MRHHQKDQHTVGIPRGREREREKRTERIFEKIMTENSPNLMKDKNVNIQEVQQTPSKMN